MRGVIINHESSYIGDLSKLFNECDIIHYKDFDKKLMEKYHYIVLSGGDINITGLDDLVMEKEFLKNTHKPILGICLGHQLMGILNDSTLYNKRLKEFGEIRRGFKKTNIIGKELDLYYYHYCFINDISDDFIVDYGVHQGQRFITFMENRERKILGIQGHPEKSEGDGLLIKKYFLDNYVK